MQSADLMAIASVALVVKLAQKSNQRVTLRRVSPAIRLMLEITRFDRLVTITEE